MMDIKGDSVDSDSDRQLHHVSANARPTRRRLSSSAVVKPDGTLTRNPHDNQLSDQGSSENTLSAIESGVEEAEGEDEKRRGEGGSGEPAHRGKRVRRERPEKRAHHHIHHVTKHKKKKHFSRVGRPSKRRRGQPNVGQGEGEMRGWSESSDSDVEGGRGTEVKGVRRSRRRNKGNYLAYREHSKGEDGSPLLAKRQKTLRDSTTTPLKRVPPARNFLGELLTDIPEVDMCSLATELQPTTRKTSALQSQPLTLRPTAQISTSPEYSAKKQEVTATMSITPKTHSHSHSPQSHRPTLHSKHAVNLTSRGGSKGRPITREMGRKGSETTGKTSTLKSYSRQDCVGKSPEASSKEFTLHAKIDVKQKQEGKKRLRNSDTPLLSPMIELQRKSEPQSRSQQRIDKVIAQKTVMSKDPTQLSSHYRLLSTWESDYSRGSNATRAPVLYAFDTIADKLADTDGPWLERAKLIWNHWKKIPPSMHELYVERAKKNRMERQLKIAKEKPKIAPPISKQSSSEHNLLPSISKLQKSPVETVSPEQTDYPINIFSNAGTSVQRLVVSNAVVLAEALNCDCFDVIASPADGSNLPNQTALAVETISIKPNIPITEPVSLKEIQSEDLCSAVDKEIETLEETLGSSPPAVPYSPRAISLSPCSLRSPPVRPSAPHVPSPSREIEPRPPHQPSQPSPPTKWAPTLGQRHAYQDSKSVMQRSDTIISKTNGSSSSRRICLPNPKELSSFCASSALISPVCPISPTCTKSSSPPPVSSVAKQETKAVSTTAAVFSLPLATLLPPKISMMLKDLPNSDQLQLQSISPQATSEMRSLASSQQLKSKKPAKSASVSAKQIRRRKSNFKTICVPKGVSSAPGSIQKAHRTTVPSGLTSSNAFLDTLIAKVCLPNQSQFKALQMPLDRETDVTKAASSSSSSRQSMSPSSGVSIEPLQQSPFMPLRSHLSTSHVTSPSCSSSDQSAPSTPSPLHPMANPMTQPVAVTTFTAHKSTNAAFSTCTTLPTKGQTGSSTSASQPVSCIPNMTAKTHPSGGDFSNAPLSTSSLLHTSTISPASTIAVPGIDQSAVTPPSTMNIPSCLPITPTASTLAVTDIGINAKLQPNAGDTTTLVASLPSFSFPGQISTLAPTSVTETTAPHLVAGGASTVTVPVSFKPKSTGAITPAIAVSDLGASPPKCGALNTYAGNAMIPTSSLLKPSASAPAMSDWGLNVPTPSTQGMYTGGADSIFLQQNLTTASPLPVLDLGLNPPKSRAALPTCTGNTTSSYPQQTLTTASAPDLGLNVPMPSAQGMYTGSADSSFLQGTASPSAMSNLGLNLPKPRMQDVVNSNATPSFLQHTFTSPSAMSNGGLNLSKPRTQDVVGGIATPSFLQCTFTSASTASDLGLSLPKPGVLDMYAGNVSVTASSPFQPMSSAPAETVSKSEGAQDLCTGNATPNFLQQTLTTTSASNMSDLGSKSKHRALLDNCADNTTSSYPHQALTALNVPKSGAEQGMSTGNGTHKFLQQTLTSTSDTSSSYLHQNLTTASATAIMSDLGLDLCMPSTQDMYTRSADSSFIQQTVMTASPLTVSNLGSGLPKPTTQNMNVLSGNATLPAPSLLCSTASTSDLRLNLSKPGTQYMLTGNATPSFLHRTTTSASATTDLGSKPGVLDTPSGKTTIPSPSLFQHAASASAVPSKRLNAPERLHSGNATPSLLPTLTTASSSAATGHVKRKHPRTFVSKAERLSKLGTTVNLPQGGTVPSFRIPVFHSDPFKPQTEHILPSLLGSSTSSRGPSKSFGSMTVSKLANPPRRSKTTTSEANSKKAEPMQPPTGQGFQSKFSISNFPSANAAFKQQQRQKQQYNQQQKLHPSTSTLGLTLPNPESGNTPFPFNFSSTFPMGVPKTTHQQQTSASPITSGAELCDQNRSLPFQVANTSTTSQELGSNLQSHQEPSSISSSTVNSTFPTTAPPTSKQAVSGKETSDATKHPFYVAPPSLLREFPEIGVVTTLHPSALRGSTANEQYGNTHTSPYPNPHYDLKPTLHPEAASLPSFQSLGMPSVLLRHQTESHSIDNGGAIQYYPLNKHISVTDSHTVSPAIPTSASSGDPQINTSNQQSNTSQLGIDLSSSTPHSEPNSVLTTTTPVLETLITATTMVTASSACTPALSSSTIEAPAHLKDSPSIITASPSSASVTSSANNPDWRMELLRKLREHYMSEGKGNSNRWNQHGKAGMEVKCESRSDKQTSAKKASQVKKPRKRPSKGSLSGLFTSKTPLSGDDKPLSEPRPMVAAPEQLCNELFLQSTPELASVPTPCSEDGELNPRLLVNPPIGDLSRWELERLYLYNLALLEQQRKYTKMLEKRLIMMEQEQRNKKPSKLEVYRQFLEFVVEPTRFPEAPAINFPEISSEEIVLKGTFDKPILDEGHDVYSSFSKKKS